MVRKISAVSAGYLIFAVSAGIWFPLMGYKPHSAAPWAFMLETLAYGVGFSLLAGFVAKVIGKSFLLNIYSLLSCSWARLYRCCSQAAATGHNS